MGEWTLFNEYANCTKTGRIQVFYIVYTEKKNNFISKKIKMQTFALHNVKHFAAKTS